jgi:hypothetical protein
MNKEYEQMRGALLALLCVGDKINLIHHYAEGSDIIKPCYVLKIEPDSIVIENWGAWAENCYIKSIEQYKGELYIWKERQIKRKDKIRKMISIIESAEYE